MLNAPNTNTNLYAGKLAAHGSVHLTNVVFNRKDSPKAIIGAMIPLPEARPKGGNPLDLVLLDLLVLLVLLDLVQEHLILAGRKAGRFRECDYQLLLTCSQCDYQ